jgi:hypothetical protein
MTRVALILALSVCGCSPPTSEFHVVCCTQLDRVGQRSCFASCADSAMTSDEGEDVIEACALECAKLYCEKRAELVCADVFPEGPACEAAKSKKGCTE